MKVFYVFSQEDSATQIQNNWRRCSEIFPTAQKLCGLSTILSTYNYLSELAADELFVWIDGDNLVLPAAVAAIDVTEPSIFMARNEYGITYGHGGIKVCRPGIKIRANAIDITWYLGLKSVDIVASEHQLGEGWIKTRAIFVEMIKNALKGDIARLDQWKLVRPDIWQHAEKLLNGNSIDQAISIIRHREKFREYYENSLCGNL